jgi:two-component system chemotaxis response regulator CheY
MYVLVVEPNPIMRRLMQSYLTQARYTVVTASEVRDAFTLLQQHPIALIVTAWPMPGGDGLEFLRHVRKAASYIYVLLVAASSGQESVITGLQAGADDYLVKPVDLKQLRRRVILGGRILSLENDLALVRAEHNHLLTHDYLTGLLVRERFTERAESVLHQARQAGIACSLLILELDDLNAINQRYGYHIGNKALRMVADTAVQTIRRDDLAGRWTSARIALLLVKATASAANSVATRLQSRLAATLLAVPDGPPVTLNIRTGVVTTESEQQSTLPAMVAQAETALSETTLYSSVPACKAISN